MNEARIRDRLIEHGETLIKAPREFARFTKHDDADRLLKDLTHHPHAFVLGCVMDQQIKAERAWIIPFRFMEKLGSFSMETLLRQSEADVRRLMTKPEPLHRFVNKMSTFFFKAVQRIAQQYNSDASLIWAGKPSLATVVSRFRECDGVGPKIASMAANILVRRFKIKFSDYSSIDISADVHVCRVFGRLGLTPPDASVDQVIFRARGLHPEFYMNEFCPSASKGTANKAIDAHKD